MKPHFELTFMPSESGVVNRLEQRMRISGELQGEVMNILNKHKIEPTKVYINKVEEGQGKRNSVFD